MLKIQILILFPNIENKRKMIPVFISTHYYTGGPSLCNKAGQRNKILRIRKNIN